MMKKRIVICGATGRQGGAVIRSLLATGLYQVCGLTRDPESEAARLLINMGAEMLKADHMDQDALAGAFRDAYGVFAVTQPWDPDNDRFDVRKELIQARNIIRASKESGVTHLIGTSFINPDNAVTNCSFIDSKMEIEALIRQQLSCFTILRLPLFMENIGRPDSVTKVFKGIHGTTVRLPFVSLTDLGRFVPEIFGRPDKFFNETINLIADRVSAADIKAVYDQCYGGGSVHYKQASTMWLSITRPETQRFRRYLQELSTTWYKTFFIETIQIFRHYQPQTITVREFIAARCMPVCINASV